MAQNINLQYKTYTFTSLTIYDPDQLDGFLSTYMPSECKYNSIYYNSTTDVLQVYTMEDPLGSFPTTAATIQDLLSKYPNSQPFPQRSRGVAVVNKGDLTTFSANAEKTVRLPIGLPGQVLTVDPTSTTGFSWRGITTDVTSGATTSATDLYIRYFDVYDGSGGTLITQTDVDIPFTVTRRSDKPTFEHPENSPEVTITETGKYWAYLKIGFQWKTDGAPPENTQVCAKVLVNKYDGNGFQEFTGLQTYHYLPMTLPQAQTTNTIQFGFNITTAPWTFKVVASDLKGTDHVVSGSGLSNFGIGKYVIDGPSHDETAMLTWAKTSDQTIVETPSVWTPITFDTVVTNVGGRYTLPDSETVAVTQEMGQFIVPHITFKTFGGNPNDMITIAVKLQYMMVPGYTPWEDVPLSETYIMLRVGMDNTVGIRPADFLSSYYGIVGTRFRVVYTMVSKQGTLGAKVVGNASIFAMISTWSNKSNSTHVQAVSHVCTQAIPVPNTHWEDVPLDLEMYTDDNYTLDETHTILQNSEIGTYVVMFKVGMTMASAGTNKICNAAGRIMVNAGNGFYEVNGSVATRPVRENHMVSFVGEAMMFMGYNYQLKLQVIVSEIGNMSLASGDTVTLVPYSTSVILNKMENTILPMAAPGLLVFGSYYHYLEDLTPSSTTSTSFITKATLSTEVLPKGHYRFGIYYEWSMSGTAAQFSSRVMLNNSTQLSTYSSFALISNNNYSRSYFLDLDLTQGLHTIDIDWKTTGILVMATIQNVRMELYRTR